MNDKKILFFDIDGTLLTPHPFKVPESTSRALTKAHENGHLLFINTGRTKVMMPSALSELHFDGYIYGCGTHIYMDNKLLFFRTVPNLLCKETVDLLRKCKIEAIFESNTEILYDGASPAQSEFGVKMRKEIPMVDITKFNREDACTYSYDKFLVHMLPDSDVEKFRSFCNDHYTYFDHGDGIWEVTQKGTSKATGMEFLLDRLSIPKKDCYAFGPSHAESCRSQRCYGKCLRRHRKTLHIPDKRSRQGRDSSRTGASRSNLTIHKAGMSITKNEPCTINPYTARCLFSYHSIVNIVSYFSASGVAAASDSVLSAVSSSAFAESPSVSGVSVTSGSGVGVGVWIVKL